MNRTTRTFAILTVMVSIIFFSLTGCAGPKSHGRTTREELQRYFGKVSIPSAATDLYYFSEGFMDNADYIALTLPAEDAWDFIRRYARVNRKQFSPLSRIAYLPKPPQKEWDVKNYPQALAHEHVEKDGNLIQWYRLIVYDTATGRLFIHFSTT